jgi:hypothetical protein
MAVLDAYTDNPGTWLFHCHLNDHIHGGMVALFNVAGQAPSHNLNGQVRHPQQGGGTQLELAYLYATALLCFRRLTQCLLAAKCGRGRNVMHVDSSLHPHHSSPAYLCWPQPSLSIACLHLPCFLPPSSPPLHPPTPQTREYFIAAEEVVWDYAPFGGEMCGGSLVNFTDNAKTFVEAGPDRIGRKYVKALYVEYTDATFKQKKVRHTATLPKPLHTCCACFHAFLRASRMSAHTTTACVTALGPVPPLLLLAQTAPPCPPAAAAPCARLGAPGCAGPSDQGCGGRHPACHLEEQTGRAQREHAPAWGVVRQGQRGLTIQ